MALEASGWLSKEIARHRNRFAGITVPQRIARLPASLKIGSNIRESDSV